MSQPVTSLAAQYDAYLVQDTNLIPTERIERAILTVRGQRVLLDRDLAALYGVETRVLNQAVRRNRERFPADFMFELTREEIRRMSQIVISLDRRELGFHTLLSAGKKAKS